MPVRRPLFGFMPLSSSGMPHHGQHLSLFYPCDYQQNRKHGDAFGRRQRRARPQVRHIYSAQLGHMLLAADKDDTDGQPADVMALVPE